MSAHEGKRIACFPPLADSRANVLILGSMPGKESLRQNCYYAHAQNAFWKIMGELVGAAPQLPYRERVQKLLDARIALWDVLAFCERTSSLDSHIRNEQVNDFTAFFAQHPGIRKVCFNGTKAEQSFKRQVLGKQQLPLISLQRLPSTSPAHAGMRYAAKLQAWRVAIGG